MIREATLDDLEEIIALTTELAAYEQLEHELMATVADFRSALLGSDSVVRVSPAAEDDGTVVGHALWYPTFSTFVGKPDLAEDSLSARPTAVVATAGPCSCTSGA